ncbi:hypothetical protein [Deinococcus radiopugnans]|uniref:hypothetical protein n=1 Tax=Deinococcus radiopugnans TaxID=57497 RepID=UPI000AFECDE4|nr:hypothetical protein [Deinococcus radiopugnans]
MHEGWLGQYLLVLPDSRTVAVRMIAENHQQTSTPGSNFLSFNTRVLSLLAP